MERKKTVRRLTEMAISDKTCGTCYWHTHEDIDDGWICTNSESEYCCDWTDRDSGCGKWEEYVK